MAHDYPPERSKTVSDNAGRGRREATVSHSENLYASVQNTRARAHQTLTLLSLFDASPPPSSPAC